MTAAQPYQPLAFETPGPAPAFIVLEGVSGIGKSTLARTLARRLAASSLHTLPRPHTDWASTINSRLRPLPQFAFYLSGLLHAADAIRECRPLGPVVADRYVSSVIACHAAAHRVPVNDVECLLQPFRGYLVPPTHTFYLRCSEETLRARMETKADLKRDDTDLFTVPGRLGRLLSNFEDVAARDPSAITLDTDDQSPDELADVVTRLAGGTHA
ncbi:AAA family ATPase [uncultured Streptomyces sp.]|uniref:dTMP kinase n=1 Tax=uncultured Streptomyces sp. TaxID=174707 RepID=UPI00260B1C4F|nr:AAA family ATPase [uncultured Streptomyces sp.]